MIICAHTVTEYKLIPKYIYIFSIFLIFIISITVKCTNFMSELEEENLSDRISNWKN